jgi:phage tail sheath gpL-like
MALLGDQFLELLLGQVDEETLSIARSFVDAANSYAMSARFDSERVGDEIKRRKSAEEKLRASLSEVRALKDQRDRLMRENSVLRKMFGVEAQIALAYASVAASQPDDPERPVRYGHFPDYPANGPTVADADYWKPWRKPC